MSNRSPDPPETSPRTAPDAPEAAPGQGGAAAGPHGAKLSPEASDEVAAFMAAPVQCQVEAEETRSRVCRTHGLTWRLDSPWEEECPVGVTMRTVFDLSRKASPESVLVLLNALVPPGRCRVREGDRGSWRRCQDHQLGWSGPLEECPLEILDRQMRAIYDSPAGRAVRPCSRDGAFCRMHGVPWAPDAQHCHLYTAVNDMRDTLKAGMMRIVATLARLVRVVEPIHPGMDGECLSRDLIARFGKTQCPICKAVDDAQIVLRFVV